MIKSLTPSHVTRDWKRIFLSIAQNVRTDATSLWRQYNQYQQPVLMSLLALFVAGSLWFGLTEASVEIRAALIIFSLAVLAWIGTDIDETYIALAAATTFSAMNFDPATPTFFTTLGDPTIWLLLASFVIAAGVTGSGLSQRLTQAVTSRTRSVSQLFYGLTLVLLLTAFIIPATSGRAALMAPVFIALSSGLQNFRLSRALALLFPTVILLSAIASIIGAGAHLVTAEIVVRMGGEAIGFGRWLLLGLPFALISCFASTWVILHLFLNRQERNQRFDQVGQSLSLASQKQGEPSTAPAYRQQMLMLGIVIALAIGWMTEPWHGIHCAVIAVVGALLVTAPGIGLLAFKDGMKTVNWRLLLFMAATLELGQALTQSGAAEWLVQHPLNALQNGATPSSWLIVAVVALISLLSHLLINSRTARSSVLIPLVAVMGVSLGYNPTALAFLSTAAAGFCLTLPVSAKPVAIFSQIEGHTTYSPGDLLRLSSVLLPLHFVLLLIFALVVWPALGLSL